MILIKMAEVRGSRDFGSMKVSIWTWAQILSLPFTNHGILMKSLLSYYLLLIKVQLIYKKVH